MGYKDKFINMLDIPEEVVFNVPVVTVISNNEVSVENYKGIIEYGDEKIRVNSSIGQIKIEGKKLSLKQIAVEKIIISGSIYTIEYIV